MSSLFLQAKEKLMGDKSSSGKLRELSSKYMSESSPTETTAAAAPTPSQSANASAGDDGGKAPDETGHTDHNQREQSGGSAASGPGPAP